MLVNYMKKLLEEIKMKFKMRVLHFSKAGNTEAMARAIAKQEGANSDQIPPAYPCENEKLVFVGVELKGKSADKVVIDLCRDLTQQRAKNVAFYATGSDFSALDELKQIIEGKGINVINNMYKCEVKSSLFKKGTVSQSDIDGACKWAADITNSLAN